MKSLKSTLNIMLLSGLSLGFFSGIFASEAPAPQPSKGVLSSIASGASSVANGVKSVGNGAASVIRGIGSSLLFCAAHPKLTLFTSAGLAAFYLYNCKKNSRNWTPEITAAQTETLSLDATANAVDTERSLLRCWNLRPGSASEIASNWQQTYRNLRRDFPSNKEKEQFVTNLIGKIDNEKNILKKLFAKLDSCFAQCNLLPRTKAYHPIFDNPVLSIINSYMKEQNCKYFYDLSEIQVAYLNSKIEKLTNFSLFSALNFKPWKTFNWHRLYALPSEADAIEQYWKVYQMVAHLDAMQFCLRKALTDNNLV